MPLKAIVFDFDGVIANSEPLHFQGYRDVLAEEGLTLTEPDYYARYLGFHDGGALERDVSVLSRGAADAVRRASAAMQVAIASGARGAEIRRVLEREHLIACF